MPAAIVNRGANLPTTLEACHQRIAQLEETNYIQFVTLEHTRGDLEEARHSIHLCRHRYQYNTQHQDIQCCEEGHDSNSGPRRNSGGKRFCEPNGGFNEPEHPPKRTSSSLRPSDARDNRDRRPVSNLPEDRRLWTPGRQESPAPEQRAATAASLSDAGWGRAAVLMAWSAGRDWPEQSKGGGTGTNETRVTWGSSGEHVAPPTLSTATTEGAKTMPTAPPASTADQPAIAAVASDQAVAITLTSFYEAPTTAAFVELVKKRPEMAPQGFQKGQTDTIASHARWWRYLQRAGGKLENTDTFINATLHVIASGRYKATIDEGKVKKAPTRSSPDFEGNPTDEEQIIKYLAGCVIWTQGRHYEAAIELAELRGVKGAPTPDPFAD
ncbi:hypothetical protein GLOTRDRAFT_127220 [Gloeophyllum trabeum ATCC 11539]|uniref:Uncharacterized protein n=1 Tax=Gloeophyllum trabeum (strain ATCC 11539 / FP-39264 / Madison 617) TaxID=670483 RepID=S7QBT1_GLOTA|nr:uncharacterized protein GLOTRDRAFT_127220 [Gloeophyllum trabeum ATCC 11539]EPQ56818.1 hypothetical protein GLOTRDRAFT_127220 [Gloeophyllum trabeum ATCC 11539]